MWKCTFRFSAEPNRWISVTAPVAPVARVRRAFLRIWLAISPYTIASTCVSTSGSLASKNRSANGSDSTHCRSGLAGSTSSTSRAAHSAIRRAPQLGQIARPLQLNATSFSAWQRSHFTRRKPCSKRPHFKYDSNSVCTCFGSGRSAASRAASNVG